MARLVYYDSEGFECEVPNGEPIHITNGDRIRAKTDEELAEWIAGVVLNLQYASLITETEALLKWLKQESKE